MKIKIFKYDFDNHYLPRWSVMLFDIIVISSIVLFTSIILLNNFSIQFRLNDVVFLAFYSFFSFLLSWLLIKPHLGIIRYFSINDIVRFANSCLLGTLFFLICLIVNNSFLSFTSIDIPYSIALVSFFVTTSAVVFTRVFIYYLTIESSSKAKFNKNILIYGTGNLALATRKAFLKSDNTFYNILGFIDNNPILKNRKITGLPVYNEDQVIALLQTKKAIDEVFIAADSSNNEERHSTNFVNQCIDFNIKIKEIPALSHWIKGSLHTNQIKDIKIEDLLGREEIILDFEKISKELFNQKIMITGATGSIGSEIVRQTLNFNPKELILIDRAESPLFELQDELQSINQNNIKIIYCLSDTSDQFKMVSVFEKYNPEIIFHAAAYKHVPLMEDNPYEAIKNNITSTKILADLAVKHQTKKFVLISTDKAVNPTNVMGASKRICELYVQSLSQEPTVKTKFITTRFGNVLGSNGSVIPLFKKQIERGGPLTLTHKDMIRYLMTIPEACQLVLEASTMGNGGEIFLFNMGKPVKIYDLAIKMIQLSGLVPEKDIQIKEIGLRPGEKLYEELLCDDENTIPTHHKRIMIGKYPNNGENHFKERIGNLIESLSHEDEIQLVKQMKKLVPEFVSNNSIFSVLDQ